ncbi:MAG: hypothetical protein ACREDP_24585, partial [Bradyrhizobium sp.]
ASAVPYQGSVLGHHVVLNYIDSNGKHCTLQGMPEQKFDRNAAKAFRSGQCGLPNGFSSGAAEEIEISSDRSMLLGLRATWRSTQDTPREMPPHVPNESIAHDCVVCRACFLDRDFSRAAS